MNYLKSILKIQKFGFTLIELLIVMAILGVLAVVVLVAINPAQQLARTRDSGRKSDVTQIGRALQAYFTTRQIYLTTANCATLAAGWQDCVVTTGEMKKVLSGITYNFGSDCTGGTYPTNHGEQNGWCYSATNSGDQAVVYTTLESKTEASKCDNAGYVPYFYWSSASGNSCLRCLTGNTRPFPGDTACNSKQ